MVGIITFRVNFEPVPQPRQRHRIVGQGDNAFIQNYTPEKHQVNFYKQRVQWAFRRTNSAGPLVQPVALWLLFVLPRPKAKTWKKREMTREWKPEKPDIDNLEKATMDALNGLAWKDDSYVCAKFSRKVIARGGETPGVSISFGPAELFRLSPE